MSARISTILIIGATSGLGEGFARRFHAQGKKVIATGRRQDRLNTLASQLSGLETYQWDISDLANLGKHASALLNKYEDIDTVLLMAGKQEYFSYFDASTFTDETVTSEIDTNFSAPALLARTFVPFFAKKAEAGKKVNLIFVTSGLAYVPFGFWPVYCATKSAIHYLALTLRQQMNFAPADVKANFSIVELSPPYVDTDLDVKSREQVTAILGDHAPPPMKLEEYLDQAVEGLGKEEGGKMLKEVTVPGFSEMGVKAWREGLGKILEGMHIDC